MGTLCGDYLSYCTNFKTFLEMDSFSPFEHVKMNSRIVDHTFNGKRSATLDE